MKPILKVFLGSSARHLLTGFLTLLVARHWLDAQIVAGLPIESSLTNDYVFDFLAAAAGAVLPVLWSFVSRMYSKLKERLALWLPRCSTEREVRGLISEAPISAQISATLTSDPAKILDAQ